MVEPKVERSVTYGESLAQRFEYSTGVM